VYIFTDDEYRAYSTHKNKTTDVPAKEALRYRKVFWAGRIFNIY